MPRDGTDDIRLFDWDAWRIGVASNDLAYMMATHWYPDRRRRMEQSLLDHYHTARMAYGVCDYDRRALDDDYRLSALWQIMTPVWQAGIDLPPRSGGATLSASCWPSTISVVAISWPET